MMVKIEQKRITAIALTHAMNYHINELSVMQIGPSIKYVLSYCFVETFRFLILIINTQAIEKEPF